METPKKITDIKLEYMIKWCQEHDKVSWLKEHANRKKETEDGTMKPISYIELRNEFAKEFMPDLKKKKKSKTRTFIDKINDL